MRSTTYNVQRKGSGLHIPLSKMNSGVPLMQVRWQAFVFEQLFEGMLMTPKRVAARFYLTGTGANLVRDWLMRLPVPDRRQIGHDIRDVEFGWPVGMPLCRAMGGGLWEVRSTLPSRRIARVLFCVSEGDLVLLHGFIRKAQKTPSSDLDVPLKRMKEVQS